MLNSQFQTMKSVSTARHTAVRPAAAVTVTYMLPPTPSSVFLESYFSDNSLVCFIRISTAVEATKAGNVPHLSVVLDL